MSRPLATRWAAWGLALVLLLGSALALGHAWPMARATWTAMPALKAVRDWQRPRAKPPTEDQWQQARLVLDRALAITPAHGELQEAMGYLYLSAALRPNAMAVLRAPYLRQANVHFEQAIRARPMVPSGWANQALALHALHPANAPVPELWAAFDRALAYGQREAHVRRLLADVAFGRWATTTEARRQAVWAMVALAPAGEARSLRALAQRHGVPWGA